LALNYNNQSILSLGIGGHPVLNPNNQDQPYTNIVQYVMGWNNSSAGGWSSTIPNVSFATTTGSLTQGTWCEGAPSLSDVNGAQLTFGQSMFGCFAGTQGGGSNATQNFWGTTAADDQGQNVIVDLGAPAGPTFYYPSGGRLVIPAEPAASNGLEISPLILVDVDRNGNTITYTKNAIQTVITDTLGRTVTVSSNAGSSLLASVSYLNSNGATEALTFVYGASPVASSQSLEQPSIQNGSGASYGVQNPTDPNYGVNAIQWVGVNGGNTSSVNISQVGLSAIIFPNGKTYTFQYDAWGDLIKVTYPDGGYTRYDYQKLLHGSAQVIGPAGVGQTVFQQDVLQVVAKHVCSSAATTLGATVAPTGDTCPSTEETTTYTPSAALTPNNWTIGNASNTVVTPDGTSTLSNYMSFAPVAGTFLPGGEGGLFSTYQPAVEMNETTTSSTGAFMHSVSFVYEADNAHVKSKTTTLDNNNSIIENWTYQQTNMSGVNITEMPNSPTSSQIVCSGYCSYTANPSVPFFEYSVIWNPITYTITDWTGAVLRTVATTWAPAVFNPAQPYLPAVKASEIVYQGSSSTVLSRTQYIFDNYTTFPMVASGAGQHGMAGMSFSTSNTVRGNVTAVQRWRNTDSKWLTDYIQYNDAGSKVASIDPNGNVTSYSYADSWANSACAPASGTGVAYPTQILNPYGQSARVTYNSCTGSVATSTDDNSDSTTYTYDALDRPVDIVYPETYPGTSTHAEKKTCYSDTGNCSGATAASNYVVDSHIISPSLAWAITEVDRNGIGKTISSKNLSDPYGTMEVDTSYDLMERVASVSNPYRPASGPTSGGTTYSYDPLSRKKSETHISDGTSLTWAYSGTTTKSYDETGREWTHVTDALNRLVEVLEPNLSGTDTAATQYQYDSVGNLLKVDQWGGAIGSTGDRLRSFVYNTVSELISAQNVESGILCYGQLSGSTCTGSYDLNGNPLLKTDARGIATSFTYDKLNRLTARTYSDGVTPSDCFVFGNSGGNANTNEAGRLLLEWTQPGSCASGATVPPASARNYRVVNGYDAAGHITSETQCPYAPCASAYTFPYTYDLAGNPISWTNGMPQSQTPLQFTLAVDAADRLNNVSNVLPSAASQILFRADTTTSANLGVPYGPFGLQYAENGVNSSTNQANIATARSYDGRGRILSESDTSDTGNPAVGQISITNFNEQHVTAAASGTPSTGSYQIAGSDKAVAPCPTNTAIAPDCLDYGVVNLITVPQSGAPSTVDADYENGMSASQLATSLAAAINSGSSLVSAVASNGTIQLTSKTVGSNTNYILASNVSSITTENSSSTVVSGPSFTVTTPSGSAMTGGTSSSQTVTTYDSGTVVATVESTSATISWSQSDTVSSIASRLASALQTASNGTLLVSSSAGIVTVHTVATGVSHNIPMSVTATNDSSLFPTNSVSVGATSLTANKVVYGYTIPSGSSGYLANGDLLSVSDSVMGNWTYSYDPLNRLTNATTSSGSFVGTTLAFGYDAWGNRLNETVTAGAGSMVLPQSSSATYNTFNQVSASSVAGTGFTYTAAATAGTPGSGQVTYDGLNRYAYDGDGRLCAVQNAVGSSFGYTYDAEGIRVSKGSLSTFNCTATYTLKDVYLVDLAGDQVTELNGTYAWTHSNVFAHGQLIATYDPKGTHYHFDDILGTRRVQASANGATEETCTSFPFGDGLSCGATSASTADDATEHHFTGKERDAESLLDYFGARYYSSPNGSFISPDWSSSTVPVPYADMNNPQSLNLYAYAQNNPITHEDLTGHEPFCGPMACAQAKVLADECTDRCAAFSAETALLWSQLLAQQDEYMQNKMNEENKQEKAQQQSGQSQAAATPAGSEPESAVSKLFNQPFVYNSLYYTGTFAAGASDFMTFGLTKKINDMDGGSSSIGYDSGTYTAGKVTGVGLTVATTAAGGLTRGALSEGKVVGGFFGRGGAIRGGVFNRGFIRFGWSWEGSAQGGRDVIRIGIGEAGSWIHLHIPVWYP
jgi:RHS repeat-associated protein